MTAILPDIVRQHWEEAALLHAIREVVVASPSATLGDVRRLDDRIVAHLDGMKVAGADCWRLCQNLMDPPTAGALFAATSQALSERNLSHLEQILALAEA